MTTVVMQKLKLTVSIHDFCHVQLQLKHQGILLLLPLTEQP